MWAEQTSWMRCSLPPRGCTYCGSSLLCCPSANPKSNTREASRYAGEPGRLVCRCRRAELHEDKPSCMKTSLSARQSAWNVQQALHAVATPRNALTSTILVNSLSILGTRAQCAWSGQEALTMPASPPRGSTGYAAMALALIPRLGPWRCRRPRSCRLSRATLRARPCPLPSAAEGTGSTCTGSACPCASPGPSPRTPHGP